MRRAVILLVVVLACRKEQAPEPQPQLILRKDAAIDAASDAPADASADAPADAAADAAIDAPIDARLDPGHRCKPNECWFEQERTCVVGTGQRGNALCGPRNARDDRCVVCRCAAPWTPIDTPDGPRPIAELHPGDLVLSSEGDRVVVVPIARTNRVEVSGHRASAITFDDGSQLLISAEHPLADGRMLGTLVPGELLGPRRVTSIQLAEYPFDATYDILPASSTGVYFSHGIPLGSTLRALSRSP